jgi:hypothetical protein
MRGTEYGQEFSRLVLQTKDVRATKQQRSGFSLTAGKFPFGKAAGKRSKEGKLTAAGRGWNEGDRPLLVS